MDDGLIMYFTVEVIHEKPGRKITPQQKPNIPTTHSSIQGFTSQAKNLLHLLRKILLL